MSDCTIKNNLNVEDNYVNLARKWMLSKNMNNCEMLSILDDMPDDILLLYAQTELNNMIISIHYDVKTGSVTTNITRKKYSPI